jgi:hypothetical protein
VMFEVLIMARFAIMFSLYIKIMYLKTIMFFEFCIIFEFAIHV